MRAVIVCAIVVTVICVVLGVKQALALFEGAEATTLRIHILLLLAALVVANCVIIRLAWDLFTLQQLGQGRG